MCGVTKQNKTKKIEIGFCSQDNPYIYEIYGSSQHHGKWDNCNSIINKYIKKKKSYEYKDARVKVKIQNANELGSFAR